MPYAQCPVPYAPCPMPHAWKVWGALLCGAASAASAAGEAGEAGGGAPCRGEGIEETLVAPLAARYALPHVSLASLLRTQQHRRGASPRNRTEAGLEAGPEAGPEP